MFHYRDGHSADSRRGGVQQEAAGDDEPHDRRQRCHTVRNGPQVVTAATSILINVMEYV